MNQAKIEIYSRNINKNPHVPLKGIPQHMFTLITDSQGQQTIIRGGPELDNMIVDDLKVVKQPYQESLKHLFPNDFLDEDQLAKLPHVTIATGTDAEINAYVEKMWQRAEEINKGNYDYKFLPFCGAPWCAQQNSNTVIKDLTEAAGLKFQLPKYANGQNVWALGWRGTIEHTLGDKISQYIMCDDTELPNIHTPNIGALNEELSAFLDAISEPDQKERHSFAEENQQVFAQLASAQAVIKEVQKIVRASKVINNEGDNNEQNAGNNNQPNGQQNAYSGFDYSKLFNQRPAEHTSVPEVDNAQRLRNIGEKLKAQGYGDYTADLADTTNLGVGIADLFLQHSSEEQRDEL